MFNIFSKKRPLDSHETKSTGVPLDIQKAGRIGVEEGIKKGLTLQFKMTNTLDHKKQELLGKFLERHNIVLSYHKDYGFEARDNQRLNPLKSIVMYVMDGDYQSGYAANAKCIVEEELLSVEINGDMERFDTIVREKL